MRNPQGACSTRTLFFLYRLQNPDYTLADSKLNQLGALIEAISIQTMFATFSTRWARTWKHLLVFALSAVHYPPNTQAHPVFYIISHMHRGIGKSLLVYYLSAPKNHTYNLTKLKFFKLFYFRFSCMKILLIITWILILYPFHSNYYAVISWNS